ncbi:branched-chain amino acid transport system permease protein [Bradyrhizobium sp. USDA 4538]|uniref:branched-chain amino acid ABC transporter ATP-binding protein/permease n=1 Tax=unclassified Bradyrhizobium TaxID=2631580 RepID=UPI00209CECAE|nr:MULTISPECIES: ATP-binding cassette domain-containing protein [unclassified Bradyrhizobium]MCP1842726.1 branched-chain amino acid transport system permease protein [Bradyrhizobium sp. USDA 4538]MCP1903291.1 branched-chain amino acid transport system permease protein [Bradyrhizobium sp. USDA 4537]MCP1991052.1 branched-chain amino acid transport system permease protein [Bradyrhizobium sp. USDA 4539]
MATPSRADSGVWRAALPHVLPFLGILVAAVLLPFVSNDYWVLIGTRMAIYWVLVSGLNLVVGFAGHLAIGYVALLTLGAYTTSVLVAGNVMPALPVFVALPIAGLIGAIFGVVVGLPALRLRTFYFAMSTLGFATIVTQIALAWQSVTGGGIGIAGPEFPAPFNTPWGFYALCIAFAALTTGMSANVARSRFGRALIAVRDAEVAAEASGISKPKMLIAIFLFAGALAAIAGGLFATLQTYITPDAFTFDLSVLFFIAILIGGRGSILGPMLGTIILTILPEIAAPLAAWSTFLYAVLLLVIVLVMPGGIAALLDFRNRRPLASNRAIIPRPAALADIVRRRDGGKTLQLRGIALSFGNVKAIDGLDLDIAPGAIHGLIGPNGSGKTTTLNVISGYYAAKAGTMTLGGEVLAAGQPVKRAACGIARTFQTPRVIGEASVLENVMIGGSIEGRANFVEAILALPRNGADERLLAAKAYALLGVVGLEALADIRADRLQHSELRFIEIARALMLDPDFLLLDEPAAGLSNDEIERLASLIKAVCGRGTGVLLVEHHADLIFDICHQVTVLNLGRTLAAGTPAEIRIHKEVVSAYLGG